MSNEFNLWRSITEIVNADGTSTGSTGVAGLCSKAAPIRKRGDRGRTNPPVVTHFFPTSEFRTGSKDALILTSQFNVVVENDSTGRAEAIGDRLEAILTYSALNSTARTAAVDAVPFWRSRREMPLEEEGRRELVMEAEWRFNR